MPQFTVDVREYLGNNAPYWEHNIVRIRIRGCDLPANPRQIEDLVAQKAVAKIYGSRLSLSIEHRAPGSVVGHVCRSAPRKSGASWERAEVGRLNISIYR